jgi:hypothetical protein
MGCARCLALALIRPGCELRPGQTQCWPGFFITANSFDESGASDWSGDVRRSTSQPTKPRPNVAPGRGFFNARGHSRDCVGTEYSLFGYIEASESETVAPAILRTVEAVSIGDIWDKRGWPRWRSCAWSEDCYFG